MKIKVAGLVALSVLAIGAFGSPAHANPTGDRPTVGPSILTQRSERNAQPSIVSRLTRVQGNNYIGAAASNEGAVVNGKYALSNRLSVRPGVTTELNNEDGDRRVTVLAPVTYDFNGFGGLKPFVGAGAGVSTDGDTELQVVATAGADYQLGNRYALNGSVNYLPLDDQRVDFVAGVGYRF